MSEDFAKGAACCLGCGRIIATADFRFTAWENHSYDCLGNPPDRPHGSWSPARLDSGNKGRVAALESFGEAFHDASPEPSPSRDG